MRLATRRQTSRVDKHTHHSCRTCPATSGHRLGSASGCADLQAAWCSLSAAARVEYASRIALCAAPCVRARRAMPSPRGNRSWPGGPLRPWNPKRQTSPPSWRPASAARPSSSPWSRRSCRGLGEGPARCVGGTFRREAPCWLLCTLDRFRRAGALSTRPGAHTTGALTQSRREAQGSPTSAACGMDGYDRQGAVGSRV